MSAINPQNSTVSDFRKGILAWGVTLGITLFVLFLAFLSPFVDEPFRGILMNGFAPFCHQIPTRSFHIDGVQLALCHRCLGIYGALPIALASFMIFNPWKTFLSRKAKYVILSSLVPLALDWGLDFFGIWHNTPASRLLTGGLFGIVAGYYLAVGVVQIGTSQRNVEKTDSVKTVATASEITSPSSLTGVQ